MKKETFQNGWNAFLHWQGWKICGAAWVKAWRVVACWQGWRKLFGLPFWTVVLLFALCALGLVWVFAKGLELWWPAYIPYGLSAYSLTALCVKLPGMIRMEGSCIRRSARF